ncbi:hypothetical protein JCM10213v2_001933 [Rhodosporidiobolus nylandii]
MSRRRSASLSRPVFRTDVSSPSYAFEPANALDGLALAGQDGPPPSRSRSNSLTADEPALRVELTFRQACEVEVQATRRFVKVRKAAPSSSSSSRLVPPSGRPTPKRSMTRMIPDDPWKVNDSPFEQPDYQKGLKLAGYTAPLETSRKSIKARFFKSHVDAFLEQKGLKARGNYMVRFQGTPTESHSPFTHIFVTSLPSDRSTSQIFADGPDAKKPEISTTWTFLPQENAGESHWACKAKRFWPVRVVLEGAKSTDFVPGTAPPDATVPEVEDSRSRRRKRRDTFQQELDLDDELQKREQDEAKELKRNTEQNSLRPGDSASLRVNTSVKNSASSRKNRQPDEQAADDAGPLASPSVLEAVKQLGTSVFSAVQPRIGELKNWWQQGPAASGGEEYYDDEEERARRERRRRRREKRRQQEEEDAKETAEVEKMARMTQDEEELEKAERRRRRAERRRREAELEG